MAHDDWTYLKECIATTKQSEVVAYKALEEAYSKIRNRPENASIEALHTLAVEAKQAHERYDVEQRLLDALTESVSQRDRDYVSAVSEKLDNFIGLLNSYKDSLSLNRDFDYLTAQCATMYDKRIKLKPVYNEVDYRLTLIRSMKEVVDRLRFILSQFPSKRAERGQE